MKMFLSYVIIIAGIYSSNMTIASVSLQHVSNLQLHPWREPQYEIYKIEMFESSANWRIVTTLLAYDIKAVVN